ncbi:MAG: asparagine synthase (glutamine-hydrolyzing) [Desulfovibrionaceae bacterium]
MCGIAGIHNRGNEPGPAREAALRAMTGCLAHRGPDSHGLFFDRHLALGHRRLAILDLSEAGAQPMTSADGRYTLALNGEIYNHIVLRQELGTQDWRGHSDTETVLAAFCRWQPEQVLERLRGMFALALWDAHESVLLLARDRMGEKPLYYADMGDTLLFASELKALRAHPAFPPDIDRDAVAAYLRRSCVPAPLTIYAGARKLLPGHFLRLTSAGLGRPEPYWSLREVVERGERAPFSGGPDQALDELDRLLREAVQGQMLSDVPLGALLSGGIDSSLVAAIMRAEHSGVVRTFTVGSDDPAYDESGPARAVARHLGTEHTELRVRPRDALGLVPLLADIYDEPFADASQLPTRLICALTREHVTVCLSGDGGDELFAGYNRHVWAPGLWRRLRCFPAPLRRALAALIRAVPPCRMDAAFGFFSPLLPGRLRQRTPGQKLHKLAQALPASDQKELYALLASIWPDPATLLLQGREPFLPGADPALELSGGSFQRWMRFADTATYLPDDILVKVDRAAMSVSLETRAPYLDHKVAEFAWSLPDALLSEPGRGKLLLRRLLERYVPPELTERPKTGFGVPLGSWLRSELRPWAEELLAPQRLEREGFFRSAPIRAAWQEHLSGRADNEYRLWNILMFQSWLERWGGAPGEDFAS